MRLLDNSNNVYSQTGEDGILATILETIGIRDKWCVEFGAWDGQHFSNTCLLIDNFGYSAVLIEANKKRFADLLERHGKNSNVVTLNKFVGFSPSDGLDTILATTSIPKDFDLLSIDIDGNDYHVWTAITEYTPKIVCIEYNPTIPTEVDFVQSADPSVAQGASLQALTSLGSQKGYDLVAVTSLNAIFVRSEYFHLFGIADNGPRVLREDVSLVAHIFCGYDGTIFLTGSNRMPWHRGLTFTGRLRQLPKLFRHHPDSFHLLTRLSYSVYKRLLRLLKRA
jgi:hypothetical protein